MYQTPFLASFLLALLLASPLQILANPEPLIRDKPRAQDESTFDYDRALATSQNAIGGRLGNYSLIDRNGSAISLNSLQGKPWVVSLVYTSCYQICPMTTRHLAKIVDKARATLGDDSFNVVLVGFDTPVDTPAAMQYFSERQGIGDAGWHLLSGSKSSIDAIANDLGFVYFPVAHGFDHLIQTSIIDAEGRVYRQVYGQVFETPMLVDPLIELVLGRSAPAQPLLSTLVSKIKLFCTTYDPTRDAYFFDYSLFLGMLIGGGIILITSSIVVRGLHRGQP